MSAADTSTRADQAFRTRAGQAWVMLEEQTDVQNDPFGRAALAKLGVTSGAHVLDVGCGCGQTLLQLAELVGPRGRVLGVDISESMLERARQRTAGQAAIELCGADAQNHAFVPADFDAIFSRFGVMFFEDPGAAFANLRRALRPGGRLAFVCWQGLGLNPWADLPMRAVMRVLGKDEPPDLFLPGRPGPFYLSDQERIRALLSRAGFADIAIDRCEQPLHLGGAMTLEQAVAYCRQIGPAARTAADAPAELVPSIAAALAGVLGPFVSERGVWLDAAAFVVTARSPD